MQMTVRMQPNEHVQVLSELIRNIDNNIYVGFRPIHMVFLLNEYLGIIYSNSKYIMCTKEYTT